MKFIFTLLLLQSGITFAQPTHTLLDNALPLSKNPGYAGTAETGRLNYGLSLDSPLEYWGATAHYLSYDQYLTKLHGGIGVQVLSLTSQNGRERIKRAAVNYAFQHNLGTNFTLSAGLGLQFNNEQCGLYPDEWCGINQYNESYFNFSTGILLYSDDLYMGIQYAPLQTIQQFQIIRNNYFSGQLGYTLRPFSNKTTTINTMVFYSFNRKSHFPGIQSVFNFEHFSLGAKYNHYANLSVLAGIRFWQFNLKYAVLVVKNRLNPYQKSVSEFVLEFNIPHTIKRHSKAFKFDLF